jgi:peptidoglycan/LPS O-acetylase OafA/YrhL
MTGAQAVSKGTYRPDIEGLRGVAICLVIAYHASPRRFHGGFIGVDVFFVISGYLITDLLVREIEGTGRLSLAGFYARRARRLLPASALVLLLTILACSLFLSPLQQYRLGDSASSTALYISNFWFLHQSADYFGATIANNPFLHTWSLAVEEQFYLVWPAVVLLGLRGRRPRWNLLGTIVLIAAASLVACLWLGRTFAPWAFFSPPARAWEFASGGIALLLAPRALRAPGALRASWSWLGLAGILGASVWVQGQTGWPGWRTLIPVLGTAAILNGHVPRTGAAKILELRAAQWTGRLSYSWYLWHWPLLAVAAAMHPNASLSQHLYDTALCVAGSLGLAAITHVFLENPIRFSRYLASRRTLSLAGAGMVTVVAAGTALAWQHSAARASESMDRGKIMEAFNAPYWRPGTCSSPLFLDTKVMECVGGDPASKFIVVLFGDSHASQWLPAFDGVANDRGWKLVLIHKPACPTAQLTVFSIPLNRPFTECDIWREASIRRILEIHPAAVVIANRQMQNFSPGLKGSNDTWREGSRKTLERLNSASITTVVLRDTPAPEVDIPGCLAGNSSWWAKRRAPTNNPCTTQRATALDDGVFRAEKEAAAGLSHVSVLDLSDLFCDDDVCPAIKDGLVVYRDESHLTEPFSRSLAPGLAKRLVPLISGSNRKEAKWSTLGLSLLKSVPPPRTRYVGRKKPWSYALTFRATRSDTALASETNPIRPIKGRSLAVFGNEALSLLGSVFEAWVTGAGV